MEEEDFEGCISCMKTKDLCDLFAVYGDNTETYAKMLESCFNIKVNYLQAYLLLTFTFHESQFSIIYRTLPLLDNII